MLTPRVCETPQSIPFPNTLRQGVVPNATRQTGWLIVVLRRREQEPTGGGRSIHAEQKLIPAQWR